MKIYGWHFHDCLDPQHAGRRCWGSWVPVMVQEELWSGMELAYEVREGREAEAGRHVSPNQDRAECPIPCLLQEEVQ